ncbi:MAG: beta-propeller domain-containing protein [Nanoarchaeota archaeon]|nr:beta-propeller domain-containing protein [Nanoarchaeota archaeon]
MNKQKKQKILENIFLAIFTIVLLGLTIFASGCKEVITGTVMNGSVDLSGPKKFASNEELVIAFKDSRNNYRNSVFTKGGFAVQEMALTDAAMPTATAGSGSTETPSYSETNVQVEGVDEADIVKTDGNYIYYVTSGKLIIAKSYPAADAVIVSEINFSESANQYFNAQEIFVDNDRLAIFGSSNTMFVYPGEPMPLAADAQGANDGTDVDVAGDVAVAKISAVPPRGGFYPYWRTSSTTVRVFDISNRAEPKEIKRYDFEGNYVSSRKIGKDVYFVMQSYPDYRILEQAQAEAEKNLDKPESKCIAPLYKETTNGKEGETEFIAKCTDISYMPPLRAEQFTTIVSFSINADREIQKEVIVGSGQTIYASLNNLYIANPYWDYTARNEEIGEPVVRNSQETAEKVVVSKFSLEKGKITFKAKGVASGHILNQFAMDEHNGNFRIATTISRYSDNKDLSTNNVYVLDSEMKTVGKVEEIAPGESIYAIRFMGNRAYMVTFKHVDPLFVIDLSEPTAPKILGKLKIPGYSDYLHPYDETHLIGIGKEVDESIDADKVHTEGAVYYTAIQGVKLAVFDVSDVSNPIEMYKEVIGDRGTQSLATTEHKAFLFDREKALLVVPMTVAQRKEGQPKEEEGEFVFQGAYVYNLNLAEGFRLKGKISHIDDPEKYVKSGSYFYGGSSEILRSLYINDVLWTLSGGRIQANLLSDLSLVKKLDLPVENQRDYPILY